MITEIKKDTWYKYEGKIYKAFKYDKDILPTFYLYYIDENLRKKGRARLNRIPVELHKVEELTPEEYPELYI